MELETTCLSFSIEDRSNLEIVKESIDEEEETNRNENENLPET